MVLKEFYFYKLIIIQKCLLNCIVLIKTIISRDIIKKNNIKLYKFKLSFNKFIKFKLILKMVKNIKFVYL